MNKMTAITAATITTLALALAGCSDDQTTATPAGEGSAPATAPASRDAAAFNDADIMFAQNMAAHHQQAIEMSDMLLGKEGVDEQVAALAEQIKAAQQPEIEQMNAWLEAWGADAGGGMDHGDMGHDMGDMGGGMMSEEDMAALEAAPGPEASSLYLEQMIEHHQGAVTMAQEHIEQGENPDAIALAEKIVTDQQAEIEEMRTLLETL